MMEGGAIRPGRFNEGAGAAALVSAAGSGAFLFQNTTTHLAHCPSISDISTKPDFTVIAGSGAAFRRYIYGSYPCNNLSIQTGRDKAARRSRALP